MYKRKHLRGRRLLPAVWRVGRGIVKIRTFAYPLLAVLGIYIIIYLYCDGVLWSNPYNSYTKQCLAWLDGRLDLGQNYPWLELAIFEGKYYVSFPPFPSYVFLPFVLVFGENNPESFLNLLAALVGVSYCALIAAEYGISRWYAAMLPVFLYAGNAVFPIVLTNGVWFIAQNMALTLSLMSIYYAKKGRKGLSLFLLCSASGCRPFQVIYLPLIIYIYMHDSQPEEAALKDYLLIKAYTFIPAVLLAMSYALLNYFRFGNILEFGHNYLPEFTNSEHGQFHFSYILQNLYNLVRLPDFHFDTKMSIPEFNGMNVFLCFPILLWWVFGSIKTRALTPCNLLTVSCLAVHILLLVSHKTLGGYHYGNRYVIDVLPAVFAAVCRVDPSRKADRFGLFQMLLLWGCAVHMIGYSRFLKV